MGYVLPWEKSCSQRSWKMVNQAKASFSRLSRDFFGVKVKIHCALWSSSLGAGYVLCTSVLHLGESTQLKNPEY